jgi:Tol biopolymer transport system component
VQNPLVTRRLAGVVLVACWCFALWAGSALAEVPAGPRLTFMEADGTSFRLISSDPSGGDQRVIFGGNGKSRLLPFPFSRPSWSGDGTRVAFTGLEQAGKKALFDVYGAAADGSNITKFPGTKNGLNPVLSPNGRTLAFARERQREARRPHRGMVTVFQSVSVWLLDIDRGSVKQLTPWKNGLSVYPSSFSPDGSVLAASRDRGESHSAVALRLDGPGETVLAQNAADPVYSPEGTRLAMITLGKRRTIGREGESLTFSPTELAVAAADGSGSTRLTQTRNLELMPSWDPSGKRLAYTLFVPALDESAVLGIGDSIMEINADGSCKTKVLSVPKASLFGPTWQPGPGREAGPIAC